MASHYGEHGMGNSLRDALLEVGLVSEKRPEKARRPKRGKARAGQQRTQAPAQSGGEQLPAPSRHVLRENQRRTARFVRDSTLGGGSVAENAKRALRRKIEALITASRLNDGQADVAYHFVKGKRIKRIYVTEAQRAELTAGAMVVAALDGNHHLLMRPVAEELLALAPHAVICGGASGDADSDEYPVPDDIIW
jgi:hypothetical protein